MEDKIEKALKKDMKQTDELKEMDSSNEKNKDNTKSSSSTSKPNNKLDANASNVPPLQSIEPTKKKSDTKML